ncbi:MAG: polysaccharide deacetylase family protein [bacterium]|nr:polysaccharide deacetylase family protein [bacterium]
MAPILLYHKVCTFDPSGTWVTPKQFEQQMKYLYENGYSTITPYEISEKKEKKIIITFDDAYEDFYYNAFPCMLKYGFKAVLFAISKHVGQDNSWDVNFGVKKKLMNWEQLKEVIKHGCIIGSHTVTHPELTRIPIKKVREELLNSKIDLEDKLNSKIDFISYPFGSYNQNIVKIAQETGYKMSFTSSPFIKENMVIGRMGIYIIDTIIDFKFKLNKGNNIPYLFEAIKSHTINIFSHGTWIWKNFESFLKPH